jgi:hypothetical protein
MAPILSWRGHYNMPTRLPGSPTFNRTPIRLFCHEAWNGLAGRHHAEGVGNGDSSHASDQKGGSEPEGNPEVECPSEAQARAPHKHVNTGRQPGRWRDEAAVDRR